MEVISKFPGWFSRQTRSRKLIIASVGLFSLLCMFGLLSAIFIRPKQSPVITATILKEADSVIFTTWTPGPNSLAIATDSPVPNGSETAAGSPAAPTESTLSTGSSADLTRTPLPTGLPTQGFETSTVVVLKATLSKATSGIFVLIIRVDKRLEYVDIQNSGNPPVNLSGWTLVSELGKETCILKGILQPKEVLRIWAGTGEFGFSCKFKNPIWNNNELDPAVLYNAKKEEVSRFP